VGVDVKFNIQDKVMRMTMDNGSNFIKAFVEFGFESGVVPQLPADDSNDDDDSNVEDEEVNFEFPMKEVEALQIINIDETITQSSGDGYDLDQLVDLPKHVQLGRNYGC